MNSILYVIFLVILVLFAIALGIWFGNALGSGTISTYLNWKNVNRFLRKKLGQLLAYLWRLRRQKKQRDRSS